MTENLHVLILTEEEDMGILLSRLSKKKGLVPHHVMTETEAISIIRKFDPFITFLDISNIARRKNIETLKTLKAINAARSVIVFTQTYSPRTRQKVLRAGADYCLIKPLEIRELYKCVDNFLIRKLYQAPVSRPHLVGEAYHDKAVSFRSRHFIERGPRIPCRLLVRLCPIPSWNLQQINPTQEAVTINISAGGMELETNALDDDICKLALQVNSPFNREEWIRFSGWVIWKQQLSRINRCKVGVELSQLDASEREKLLSYGNRARLTA